MKKTIGLSLLGVALLILGCVGFVSCSTLKHVDASGFLELTEEIPVASTIRNTQFIGAAGSRVYLERWQMQVLFEPEVVVYWTHLSGLPEDVIADLKSGLNPWPDPFTQDNQPMQTDGPSGHR